MHVPKTSVLVMWALLIAELDLEKCAISAYLDPQGYLSLGSAGMRPTIDNLAEGTLRIILSPFSTESPDRYLTALNQYHPCYRGSQKSTGHVHLPQHPWRAIKGISTS